MFEYESHEHEVRGYGDGEHGDGRQFPTESKPEEEVEEHDMQEIVHQVSPSESDAVLGRRLLVEGEMGREIVIHQKTEHVADGVGYVHVDPMLQNPVNRIMNARSCGTHYAKPNQFSQRLFFLHNDCKGIEKSENQRINAIIFCFLPYLP